VGARGHAANDAAAKRATTRVVPTIGEVVGAFKSAATVEYIRGVKSAAWPAFRTRLWQRNYYEHVIRNEEGLNRIRRYIDENPVRWAFDDENPERVG
jgi:putative transposase